MPFIFVPFFGTDGLSVVPDDVPPPDVPSLDEPPLEAPPLDEEPPPDDEPPPVAGMIMLYLSVISVFAALSAKYLPQPAFSHT